MSLMRCLMAGLLTLTLVACGGKEEDPSGSGGGGLLTLAAPGSPEAARAPKADVSGDAKSLVPNDAVAVLYMPSIDSMVGKVRKLLGAFDPSAAEELDPATMVGQMLPPPLAANADTSRPLVVAMRMSPRGEPAPTMIVPVNDVAAAVQGLKDMGMPGEAPSAGKYVAMVQGPAAPAYGASPLMDGLPAGDLVLRVDMAAIAKQFGPDIEKAFGDGMGRGGMPPGMEQIGDAIKNGLKTFMDSAERLDVVLATDGSNVEMGAAFLVKEGSEMDGMFKGDSALAAMAATLPDSYPIRMLLHLDGAKIMEAMQPLMESTMEAMPEEQQAAMAAQFEAAAEIYKMLGMDHAMAFRVDENGMRGFWTSACDDPKAVLARYDTMIAKMGDAMASMGIEITPAGGGTVAGAEVRSYTMSMDMEKMGAGQEMPPEAAQAASDAMRRMFGGDEMRMSVAALDKRLVWSMGGDESFIAEAIQHGSRTGKGSGALAEGVARAGSHPMMVVSLDLRAMVGGFMGLVRDIMPPEAAAEMPQLPEGAPIPVMLYAGGEGRTMGGGMKVDVGQIAEVVKAMQDK